MVPGCYVVAAPLDSTAMVEGYDVIVVGGGTAGSVVAGRLVEAGRHVLVLEAGPDYGSFGTLGWPSDLLDAATIPTSHDWGYRSGDELPGRALPYERARVIGGCSTHNGCTVSWGHRLDYDGWAARGLDGWSADDLLPLFGEASLRMRVRRFRDDEVAPFHRAFIDAGLDMGMPELDDLESLDGVPSVCAEPSNSPEGVRWNAAFAYLDPVRGRPELEVRGGVTVTHVVVEGGRAIGVDLVEGGVADTVWADLVVVAGGTYGSPELLLRSGIGPAEELWNLGLDIVADVPGVGRNLHDHPGFELYFEPSAELERRTTAFRATGKPVPDEQAFAKVATSRAVDGVFDTHLFPEVAMDGRLAIFTALLTPRSRGALTLRSDDPSVAPLIDHAYLQDPDGHDLAALTEGVELARGVRGEPGDEGPAPPRGGAGSRHQGRRAGRRGAGGGDPLLASGGDVRDGWARRSGGGHRRRRPGPWGGRAGRGRRVPDAHDGPCHHEPAHRGDRRAHRRLPDLTARSDRPEAVCYPCRM